MKKSTMNYVAPEVELVEMAVENGFAASDFETYGEVDVEEW